MRAGFCDARGRRHAFDHRMGEGMRTYKYCQPPAGGSLRSSTFTLMRRLEYKTLSRVARLASASCQRLASASCQRLYGVAIMNGRRDGHDRVHAHEAYEAKK